MLPISGSECIRLNLGNLIINCESLNVTAHTKIQCAAELTSVTSTRRQWKQKMDP